MPPEFIVGVDERFEVMAAPGLVDSFEHGQRIAADSDVQKLMFGLGRRKGVAWVGLMLSQPSSIVSKAPIRHLADLRGKRFGSSPRNSQTVALDRLNSTPVGYDPG